MQFPCVKSKNFPYNSSMISVKHPDPACNRAQEEFLRRVPESDRRKHELLFSYGNASFCYYRLCDEVEPSAEDFENWLDNLDERMVGIMRAMGLEKCKKTLPFQRYLLERRDHNYDQFIRSMLPREDYIDYCLMQGLPVML
jgi:hypothetical protein